MGHACPISIPLEPQLQLARDMPELINESVPRGAHFDSINSAIAYWSAPDVRQRSTTLRT